MEKIRARIATKKNFYVHNDLSNAAYHFKKLIEGRLERGERDGIAFEYLAMAVMLAFTFEAKINFLGAKLIEDWKERQPFDAKVKEVFTLLGVPRDSQKRPYSSIEQMKTFRDSVAHGKPMEIEHDEEVVMTADGLDSRIRLEVDWTEECSHNKVFAAYEDLDTLWKELLEKAKLDLFDTLSGGEGSITLIEKIRDA